MSTWTAFYVQSDKEKAIIDKLGSLTGTEPYKDTFPKDFDDHYLMGEEYPDYLLIGREQSGWITVVHNSSNKLEDWCQTLSNELNTVVIATMAQSVVSYYYFALYDNGQKRREIEVCYEGDFNEINFGKRFDFENEKPGTISGSEGETEYYFDMDNIEEYCRQFGLTIQSDYTKIGWTILKGFKKGTSVKEYIMEGYKKPWWKFW